MEKNANLADDRYSWISKGWKTEVARGSHGDIYIGQVKGKTRRGMGYYDSGWIVAPIILLNYVNETGADASGIENWREYMKEYGWEETNDFHALWEYKSDFVNYEVSRIDEKAENISFNHNPHFTQGSGLRGPDTFPLIGSNDDLIFFVEHVRKEDIPIKFNIGNRKRIFKECLRIQKSDAENLFRGIVHFSNNFSRHSSERMDNLAKILMDWEAVRRG